MATSATTRVTPTASMIRMGGNMRRPVRPIKKVTLESASIRLHELHGDSPATWQNRMFGATSDYQQVARMNAVLVDLGLSDKVSDFMVPVFASVAPRNLPHWTELIHVHNSSDAFEDAAQAELIKNATDENLDRYISQLANDVRIAESLLATLEAERQQRREAKS